MKRIVWIALCIWWPPLAVITLVCWALALVFGAGMAVGHAADPDCCKRCGGDWFECRSAACRGLR